MCNMSPKIITVFTRSTFPIRYSVPPWISFARSSRKVSLRCHVMAVCTHSGLNSGKTSLIHSLAGELSLDIYVLSLSAKGYDNLFSSRATSDTDGTPH